MKGLLLTSFFVNFFHPGISDDRCGTNHNYENGNSRHQLLECSTGGNVDPDESLIPIPPASGQQSTQPTQYGFSAAPTTIDPQPAYTQPAAGPVSSGGYGANQLLSVNTCVLYYDPRPDFQIATDVQCRKTCYEMMLWQSLENHTSSSTCKSHEIPDPNHLRVPGNCTCNEPLLDELADDFISALPKMDKLLEVMDKIFKAFEIVIAIGVLAIPGVGEAIDGALLIGISVAKIAEYTYSAGRLGAQAFKTWAESAGRQMPSDYGKVFDTYRGASDNLMPGGFKRPLNIPKGSGKAGDRGCPQCEPDPPPPPKIEVPNNPPNNGAGKPGPKKGKNDSKETNKKPPDRTTKKSEPTSTLITKSASTSTSRSIFTPKSTSTSIFTTQSTSQSTSTSTSEITSTFTSTITSTQSPEPTGKLNINKNIQNTTQVSWKRRIKGPHLI